MKPIQHHLDSNPRKLLRLWPGVAIAIVMCVLRFGLPLINPDATVFGIPLAIIGVVGGLVGALAIVIWWLFFSRALWSERLGAIALMAAIFFATSRVIHESIAGGMMGMMLVLYAVPVLSLALVVWALATRHLGDGVRRVWLVAALLLASVPWTLVRTDGITGSGSEFHWRWTPTPEERLLAQADELPAVAPGAGPATLPPAPGMTQEPLQTETPDTSSEASKPSAAPQAESSDETARNKPAQSEPADEREGEAATAGAATSANTRSSWPGFRGPARDGVVHGPIIDTNWSSSPPIELWRRPIGPGWSSFAVRGDLIYTQEQRGEEEIVAAYSMTTGKPVWRHSDPVRFYESNAGPGPRGTPTLGGDRVYAVGATGIVKVLNAANGASVWSRNAVSDTKSQLPDWGIASSPLLIDDLVVVAVSGTLTAYEAATGKPRWTGPQHGGSYSSPHLATIDGVRQILLLSGFGATAVDPANGNVLWEHAWEGSAIVQPAVISDGEILISTSGGAGGVGMRRLSVSRGSGAWKIEERWASNGLKPYFNDFVVHKGHAFGFDGSILSCIDLEHGRRTWKGGRYGNGQMVLLADQDLLLVLSEEGELALVRAASDQFTEVARFPALDSKTWNHPVLVGDVLLVRNGEAMVAFRLPIAGS
jgi:outer membrane protein assembly factor BamB